MIENRVVVTCVKPFQVIKLEWKLNVDKYRKRKIPEEAIRHYLYINEKEIPKEFLWSLEHENSTQGLIELSGKLYLKLFEYTKENPYKMSDIISYAMLLYYQKIDSIS